MCEGMFLSASDVKSITQRLLERSRADTCVIEVEGGEERSLRFARGGATTNMAASKTTLRVTSHIGGRKGSVAAASLDEAELDRALARSEEIARLLPADPEYISPLGPQDYVVTRRYDEATGTQGLDGLARAAATVISESAERQVDAFGCGSSGRRFEALATSAGLFAYERRSEADISVTARNRADSWSGWASANEFCLSKLDVAGVARRATEKAAHDTPPLDIEPARYTVIFEPAATAELARWLVLAMNARAADEGRSFFSRVGGEAKLGEALFDEKLSIRSGPQDNLAPESSFGLEGVPQIKRSWIEKGVVASLHRSRYWAKKTEAEAVPSVRNFTVEGGETAFDEMIRATKRGLLVTRLWYTNMVDPRSLLLTGLTRDGNFLIENGRVTTPVRNMRFNESLAALFSNIEAMGPTERTWRAVSGGVVAAPPMMVAGFNFSSKSSGI
jgi:predicted Zn-dependent protease